MNIIGEDIKLVTMTDKDIMKKLETLDNELLDGNLVEERSGGNTLALASEDILTDKEVKDKLRLPLRYSRVPKPAAPPAPAYTTNEEAINSMNNLIDQLNAPKQAPKPYVCATR